jgi:hypothetical protein
MNGLTAHIALMWVFIAWLMPSCLIKIDDVRQPFSYATTADTKIGVYLLLNLIMSVQEHNIIIR